MPPGESRRISFALEPRDFACYDAQRTDWIVESGVYGIQAASSSRDIRLTGQVTVENGCAGPDLRGSAPAYYAPGGRPLDIPREQFEALLGHPVQPWRPVRPYTANTTVGELRTCAMGRQLADQVEGGMRQMLAGAGDIGAMLEAMLEDMPLRQLGMMAPDQFGGDKLDGLLQLLNMQPEE